MENPTTPTLDLFKVRPLYWWQNKCQNLFFLCKHVLSEAFLDKFNDMGRIHEVICKFLMDEKERRKLLTVFRGSYKTTMLMGYVIWLFIWSIYNKKPCSVLYNTASRENAESFNQEVRHMLLECKLLHKICPWIPRREGEYKKFTAKRVEYKWFRFDVASMDTRQVSRHYLIVLNDDLVNDTNAFSEVEREKIKRQWRYQKSIITKYKKDRVGVEIEVGTPYHRNDLFAWLMVKNQNYKKMVIPYEINGYLTFPEKFSWEDYEEILADQGTSIFATQYKLIVLEEEDTICKEEWIKHYKWLPQNRYRFMTVDPAGIEEKKAHYTGITICDHDDMGNIYVIFAKKFKVTPKKLINLMKTLRDIYKPDEIFIEREKYSITIADTIEHVCPSLIFSFVNPKNIPKERRIRRLKQWWETGRFFHNQGLDELEADAIEYPDIQDEAILDALAYQISDEVHDIPNKRYHPDFEPEEEPGFADEMDMVFAKINRAREERQRENELYF